MRLRPKAKAELYRSNYGRTPRQHGKPQATPAPPLAVESLSRRSAGRLSLISRRSGGLLPGGLHLRRQVRRVFDKGDDLPHLFIAQDFLPGRHASETNPVLDDPEKMSVRIARDMSGDLRHRRIELGAHGTDTLRGSAMAKRAVAFVECERRRSGSPPSAASDSAAWARCGPRSRPWPCWPASAPLCREDCRPQSGTCQGEDTDRSLRE